MTIVIEPLVTSKQRPKSKLIPMELHPKVGSGKTFCFSREPVKKEIFLKNKHIKENNLMRRGRAHFFLGDISLLMQILGARAHFVECVVMALLFCM